MSSSLNVSAKDKASCLIKSRVNRALFKAAVKAKRDGNLTQTQIADQMGVDKSALSRIIIGRGNLTLKTIGDISWAHGLRPEITFSKIQMKDLDSANHPAMRAETKKMNPDESPRSTDIGMTTITSPQEGEKPQTGALQSEGLIVEN